jgi:hypothetical protein
MTDVERFWTAIPVGEDKADGATEIWRRYDLGSRSSLHQKLNQLTAEGRIKRISRPMPQGGEVHLYYRQRNDRDGFDLYGGHHYKMRLPQ